MQALFPHQLYNYIYIRIIQDIPGIGCQYPLIQFSQPGFIYIPDQNLFDLVSVPIYSLIFSVFSLKIFTTPLPTLPKPNRPTLMIANPIFPSLSLVTNFVHFNTDYGDFQPYSCESNHHLTAYFKNDKKTDGNQKHDSHLHSDPGLILQQPLIYQITPGTKLNPCHPEHRYSYQLIQLSSGKSLPPIPKATAKATASEPRTNKKAVFTMVIKFNLLQVIKIAKTIIIYFAILPDIGLLTCFTIILSTKYPARV